MAEETPKKKTVRKKTAKTSTTAAKKTTSSSTSPSKKPSAGSATKKKKSSSTSAKKTSSATSARKKKTSTKSSTTRKKKKIGTPKKAPSKKAAAQGEEEDNPTMLMVGAIVVAILAVVGLYLMQSNRGDEPDTSDETSEVETADGEGESGEGESAEGGGGEAADWATAPSDVAAPPANAERSATGLASRVITPGTGTAHPGPTDRVTVHYSGWTTDGELFDSSRRRGEPTSFGLNRVIPGWTEGVQLMVVGETRRFWIPANLAYEGRPGPQGMLVFDVELISIP